MLVWRHFDVMRTLDRFKFWVQSYYFRDHEFDAASRAQRSAKRRLVRISAPDEAARGVKPIRQIGGFSVNESKLLDSQRANLDIKWQIVGWMSVMLTECSLILENIVEPNSSYKCFGKNKIKGWETHNIDRSENERNERMLKNVVNFNRKRNA